MFSIGVDSSSSMVISGAPVRTINVSFSSEAIAHLKRSRRKAILVSSAAHYTHTQRDVLCFLFKKEETDANELVVKSMDDRERERATALGSEGERDWIT